MNSVGGGHGDPVVPLHGDPTWRCLWRHLTPALAGNTRCDDVLKGGEPAVVKEPALLVRKEPRERRCPVHLVRRPKCLEVVYPDLRGLMHVPPRFGKERRHVAPCTAGLTAGEKCLRNHGVLKQGAERTGEKRNPPTSTGFAFPSGNGLFIRRRTSAGALSGPRAGTGPVRRSAYEPLQPVSRHSRGVLPEPFLRAGNKSLPCRSVPSSR